MPLLPFWFKSIFNSILKPWSKFNTYLTTKWTPVCTCPRKDSLPQADFTHLSAETSQSLNLTQSSKILCANSIMSISSGWMFWNWSCSECPLETCTPTKNYPFPFPIRSASTVVVDFASLHTHRLCDFLRAGLFKNNAVALKKTTSKQKNSCYWWKAAALQQQRSSRCWNLPMHTGWKRGPQKQGTRNDWMWS